MQLNQFRFALREENIENTNPDLFAKLKKHSVLSTANLNMLDNTLDEMKRARLSQSHPLQYQKLNVTKAKLLEIGGPEYENNPGFKLLVDLISELAIENGWNFFDEKTWKK